jgi:hypothetical protein
MFKLETISDTGLSVSHSEHGHVYTFLISTDDKGKRRLTPHQYRQNDVAKYSASFFEHDALAFATNEARTRGIVD